MDLNKVATIDIESTNLLSDMIDFSSFPYKIKDTERLWCVVIMNVATKKAVRLIKEEITKERLKKELEDYEVIVAHNGIKFDFISLKLFGVFDYKIGWLSEKDSLFDREVMFIDTLVISRLINPVLPGGHSLDEWGKRLGHHKTDFRQLCIDKGYIQKGDPIGQEFKTFVPEMVEYCENDCLVNALMYEELRKELNAYKGWFVSIKKEQKLADLAIKRESFGFGFDKEAAIKAYDELTNLITEKTNIVNPLLPPKKVNQTELNSLTPPKTQLLKDGSPSSYMIKFAERNGAVLEKFEDNYYLKYKDKNFKLPFNEPLQTTIEADISNLDHVKDYLLSLGWVPTEWRERDLTKDSKKILLPLDKRVKALDRWLKETVEGKYTNYRLDILEGKTLQEKYSNLRERLEKDFPVRVRTSPCVRVGIEKELCPNLIELGDTVDFAKDFALYLTYKSRRSNIGGGEIDEGEFEKGYLSSFREVDQRIPTPSIEIGAISTRYKHISVANIPRVTSVYGEEVRSLFGAGKGFLEYGFDFSGLEARVMGHYVFPFERGEELAVSMMAEKPNDFHTKNANNLGISRTEAKSFGYMLIYGGSVNKVMLMLKVNREEATKLYNAFWDGVPALKQFKEYLEKQWEDNGRKFIYGIDGRKIQTRSKHSILNNAFQSCGVICAKYSHVFLFEDLEKQGYCIDPFEGRPDVCSMIEYHDEAQLAIRPDLAEFKVFDTKDQAEEYVSDYDEAYQLSTIGKGKEDKYFITLPNAVSKATQDAIKRTTDMLQLNVELGYEWVVGRNWAQCH